MKKIIQAFIFLAFISQGAFGVDEGVWDADKNNLIEKNLDTEDSRYYNITAWLKEKQYTP